MQTITRRGFLKGAALASGYAAAFPRLALAQSGSANDTIRVAVIGFNSKGVTHLEAFQKIPGCRLVALCDADQAVLDRETRKLDQAGHKVDGYIDLRKVLDRKDIDVVVTATPNHWHSLITVWACQAGKDVYVEKPVSHELWEGRKAVEAARKYGRIVEAGTQSRSDPALDEAFAYLQQGQVGKMLVARGFCYKRRESIGKVRGPQRVPATVNYDLWTGPAPLTPLMRKNLHYDWHWVWPTGNGDIGNQGIHELDMCRWALGQKGLPPRVMSVGGRLGYEDDAETPNTQIAFFDYKPVPMIFEVRGLPRAKGGEGEEMDNYKSARVGVVIECENGYFTGGAGGGSVFDRQGKRLKQFKGTGGRDHQENFIKAVRSRKVADLTADIEVGHLSAGLFHMANLSYRLGQKSAPGEIQERIQTDPFALETWGRFTEHLKANEVDLAKTPATLGPWLTIDPATEKFVGDWSEYANLWIRRAYREPYAIRDNV
jgi:predicted dehydrogenase